MKTDAYTKLVLTVMAIVLVSNALKPVLNPETASAQGTAGKQAPTVARTNWEYKMITVSNPTEDSIISWGEDGEALPKPVQYLVKAEELGAQGWELVSFTPLSHPVSGPGGRTTNYAFVYKRQKR